MDREGLESLRDKVAEEREFNFRWIARHESDWHPGAAAVRAAHVTRCERWLAALDAVLGDGPDVDAATGTADDAISSGMVLACDAAGRELAAGVRRA